MKTDPELVINSRQIDLELCNLLGDKPADFLVLHLDGIPLEGFGTPFDTPSNRKTRQGLVDLLNDRSKESLWPDFWDNWSGSVIRQFGLIGVAAEDFRPCVSYKISRVCPGYSEQLHCAIGLFETLASKIEWWSISKHERCIVTIIGKNGVKFQRLGKIPSLVIAETVKEFLAQK